MMRKSLILSSILISFGLVPAACGHDAEEAGLMGTWEGTLPLPSTGETVPITYQFRPDGLTVTLGLGAQRITTEWERWEISSAQGDDLVVTIHRTDNRVFSALVRHLGDGQLLLWDWGTDLSTAARVTRLPEAPPPLIDFPDAQWQ